MIAQGVFIALGLVLTLLSGCVGTVDAVIEVRASIVDDRGVGYENCHISLFSGSGKSPAMSREVGGGEITEWFTLSSGLDAVVISLKCDGSESEYMSRVFGDDELYPLELGTITLERQ